MASALPFLPGYNTQTKNKTEFHKSHLFDIHNGVPVNTLKADDVTDTYSFPVNAEATLSLSRYPEDFNQSVDQKYKTQNSTLNNLSSLPAWVAYDRKVLRFYAYFKEAVFSSQTENARLRKCVLYYYLEDDSVHIAEPKVENSGIPQGVFVKRHRIPKANNEFINLNDLFISNDLSLYGRKFHLYDCDEFTKSFFAESGSPMPPAEQAPMDQFTKKNTVEHMSWKKPMHPMKEFMEASLGKQMGVDIRATQKFLKNDGMVLRFYCVWDDTKMFGEKRPYCLHYFLADDTIEIMEVKQANSGRDAFPAMLKRSRLPKKYGMASADLTSIGCKVGADVQYYTEADLKVGGSVIVYGRLLKMADCDDFTKKFYKANYGMTDADFPHYAGPASEEKPVYIEAPPYTGFGTEEDSLGSFLYLNPRVPKVDFKKQMENDGLLLRFLAKFTSPSPEDKNRRFIITYYMMNDTIAIFEKFERNSGFIGGKFLERGRIKNPNNNNMFYTTQDLTIGQYLTLNDFEFAVIDADDFTKKFIRSNPTHFSPQAVADANGSEAAFNPEVTF